MVFLAAVALFLVGLVVVVVFVTALLLLSSVVTVAFHVVVAVGGGGVLLSAVVWMLMLACTDPVTVAIKSRFNRSPVRIMMFNVMFLLREIQRCANRREHT